MIWKNWFFRKEKIFANYHLYKIPYALIEGVNQFEEIHDGYVGADEFWSICDSRMSGTKRNRFVSNILMKSRKRNLTYIFTAQLLELLDKRIRKVLDFSSYPMLNREESVCKVQVFRTGYPNAGSYMKTFYFKTPEVFTLFNTNEEISMEDETKEKLTFRFQESPEHKPIFFETWEEADKAGEQYWNKLVKQKGGLPF